MAQTPFHITMRATQVFLNNKEVEKRIGRNRKKVLMRAGGKIRTISKWSIRKVRDRNNASNPGKPPKSHDYPQHRLRMIEFRYDLRTNSMVVGPKGLMSAQGTTVPEIHEKSRTVYRRVTTWNRRGKASREQKFGFWRKYGRNRYQRKSTQTQNVRARYPARPYMVPAYEKALPEIRSMWTDSLLK